MESNDVREFLMSRRARVTPAQAGLPAYGGARRVAGLKREEVAMLTGVSTEYYARLERRNLRGVSDSVHESLAAALQLDEAERPPCSSWQRLPSPSRTAGTSRVRAEVRPSVQGILAGMTGTPAYVGNSRWTSWQPIAFASPSMRSTSRRSLVMSAAISGLPIRI